MCLKGPALTRLKFKRFLNRASKQPLKALASMNTQTHTHTLAQVKHCWRLMEAVIGVEVSTDTPDPKIMRQKRERELHGNGEG